MLHNLLISRNLQKEQELAFADFRRSSPILSDFGRVFSHGFSYGIQTHQHRALGRTCGLEIENRPLILHSERCPKEPITTVHSTQTRYLAGTGSRKPRPAAAARHPESALPAPETPEIGPGLLAALVAMLVALEGDACHREARNCRPLASREIRAVLDPPVAHAPARSASEGP